MRTLYYVPIIHTSADMGSLANALTRCGISQVGEKMWQEHVNAVHKFWDVIAGFMESIPASGLKIYQDGLVADGEIGLKIIAAGAQSGSRNYQIVEALIKRGAEIVKTEDFKLVLEERDRLLEIIEAPTSLAKVWASFKYRFIKHRLLTRRDSFIARQIDETLATGQSGVLFIGAYHRLRRILPKDIKVVEVKEAAKIRQYHKLLPFCNNHRRKFIVLSRYLKASVKQEFVTVPPPCPPQSLVGKGGL